MTEPPHQTPQAPSRGDPGEPSPQTPQGAARGPERWDRRLTWLAGLAVLGMLAVGYVIVFLTPADALQGLPQKIFYLHVSSFVAGYLCFAVTVLGGAYYLWRGDDRADRAARAGALPGLVFVINCLVMGTIWAYPTWNWNPLESWDARYTSTVVLIALYVGYFLVRRFATPGRSARRLAAVVGIVGFLDVPVVYFSVDWWRTLHPGHLLESDQLPVSMLLTYGLTQLATLFLAAVLVGIRYRVESRHDEREEEVAAAFDRAPAAGSPL